MAAVLQLGKLAGMVDEHQPGTTTVHGQLIHMTAAAQHTVPVIALRHGHQKLLPILAARTALLQDPRLPHMVVMTPGAPRHLLIKATVAVRIMNGAAILHQAAGLVVVSKITHHLMPLPLVHTSQLLHPQR
jgi:hypothetical protein